jgi:diguanylate cyclase
MATFFLLDRDTNSTFIEIRNFQVKLLKIIVGLGLLGVVAIWVKDIWILDYANLFQRIAYPSLITLLSGSFLILCFWQQGYSVAALTAVMGFAAYCNFGLQNIIYGNESAQHINAITGTIQWFPLIYLTVFIFLKRHQAIIVSVSIYSSVLAIILYKFLFGMNSTDNPDILPILVQMVCSHPIYIALLLWIILIQNYLIKALIQINYMKRIINFDCLTGILNRRAINEVLQQKLIQTKKNIAVILVDIDHFKRINDNYGHDVGDQVLITVANVLNCNVTKESSLGRWGGEEFLIVVSEATPEITAKLAHKLCTCISQKSYLSVERVTASFGIAMSQPNDTMKSLIKRADIALYQAKNNGRNRVEFTSLKVSN